MDVFTDLHPGEDNIKNKVVESEIIKSTYYAKKAIDKNQFEGMVLAGDFNFPYVESDKEDTSHVKRISK